jgi:two-component system response regulator (stage 0 sporulation protein A)
MFTLEQKVDLILRYNTSSDEEQRAKLKRLMVKALNSNEPVTPVEPEAPATSTVDDLIFDMLKNLGVPQHISGYDYITRAIKLQILDPSYTKRVTQRLYPDIGALYNATGSQVERCIRHAVEYVFSNGDWNNIERVFGNTISIRRGNVTNREFIIACKNEIARKMKKLGIEV